MHFTLRPSFVKDERKDHYLSESRPTGISFVERNYVIGTVNLEEFLGFFRPPTQPGLGRTVLSVCS